MGAGATGGRVGDRLSSAVGSGWGRSGWGRWVLAVAAPVALGLLIAAVGTEEYRLGTGFIAVVVIVAAVGGTGPGVLAAVVSGLGMWLTVIPPTTGWGMDVPEGPVSLAMFAASSATVIAVVAQRDRQARTVAALEQRFHRLVDVGLVGVITWEVHGPITDANDTFLDMIGYERGDLDHGRIDWVALTPPEYRDVDERKVAELVANGFHTPYEKEYVRKDGSRVALMVGSAFFEGSRTDGISFMVDVSDRWRLEADRAALLAAESRAREEAEAAGRRLAAISDVSSQLLRATGPQDVLVQLADALVGRLGDFVGVYLHDSGLLRRQAMAHVGRPDIAARLVGGPPVAAASPSPAAVAVRTGVRQPIHGFGPRDAAEVDPDDEYQRLVAELEIGEGWALPLRARRGTIGVLVVARTAGTGGIDAADQVALQEIADRAASVYLNALDVQTERAVAARLQLALLPSTVPELEHQEVGTCYVPASGDRLVGGDWWDAIDLGGGRVAVVIGDVTGHGVATAAQMAELRNAIRGLLHHGLSPAEALASASSFLAAHHPGEYATAAVALHDPTAGLLTIARAGHPPMLLLDGDEVHVLEGHGGTLLGLDGRPCVDECVPVGPDFQLIAYTDGLVETPGEPIDVGIQRLAAAAQALPARWPAMQGAEHLVAELVGDDNRDDVCVVILRGRRVASG